MRTEDGHLIYQCLNGDSTAFGLLVDKYKASIFALAYAKLGSFHDAEDATQETFIKAYQKLRALKRWDKFAAWLHTIASNICKNWKRRQFSQPDREYLADQNRELLDRLSMGAYRQDATLEVLHEALAALPETYRQVLTLHYLGGLSCREIAQFLLTTPHAVEMRLSRARAQLKKEMLDMMNATFAARRLQPAFTFRVVEALKRTQIQPTAQTTPLALGLSIASGLVIVWLSFTASLEPLHTIGRLIGSALPTKAQVTEHGAIPVDAIEITTATILSADKGEGDLGKKPTHRVLNAFAPAGREGKWEEQADMPGAKAAFATGVVDGKIYLIGGERGGIGMSELEAYTPTTGVWERKADMPTERAHLAASVVDGIIYAIGGSHSHNLVVTVFSVVEAYDPRRDTWTRKAKMPTKRTFLSTCVVNGQIYAIGGTEEIPGIRGLNIVEVYNPATNSWQERSPMPTARSVLAASVVDGVIYAIGGYNDQGVLPTVEAYNPATDRWTRKADMPTPRANLSTCVVDGKIYAVGGNRNADALATVEIYDPATDTWSTGDEMPTARVQLAVSAVDGFIYAFGGRGVDKFPTAAVEVFDTGFRDQAVNPQGKFPTVWGELKDR